MLCLSSRALLTSSNASFTSSGGATFWKLTSVTRKPES